MSNIGNLSTLETLSGGDSIAVYAANQGDTRRASLTTLSSYISGQASGYIPVYITKYSQPTASGFTVTLDANSNNTHLILTPLAAYAAGSIVLPPATSAIDKQVFTLNTTQAVTALTVSSTGASVIGAPSSLAQFGFFTLKYDAQNLTWYRIG